MGNLRESLLIGVDGGGTGCRVLVGTNTRGALAEATGGRANVSTDFDGAMAHITDAIKSALAQAGLHVTDNSAVTAHLGLAGVISDAVAQRVAAALPFAHATVTDDRATALAGALGPQDGFMVAAGTGTIVARQAGGRRTHVGGWGFQLSDQASGAWLGRELLQRALLCHDGIAEPSPLIRAVSEEIGGATGIVQFGLVSGPADYAALAPRIIAAAAAQDSVAVTLMRDGASYIGQALAALGFEPGNPLCLTGGVGGHYAAYLDDAMRQGLQPPRGTAVQGAFALAAARCAPGSDRSLRRGRPPEIKQCP